jgi:uncharacterized protein YdcH (DUF465 family)
MKRLSVDQILKPGTMMITEKIDFDDPKNAHFKNLFEETNKRQEKLVELKKNDPSLYDLRITI